VQNAPCAVVAQSVEHFLGKEEVGSSNLLNSSNYSNTAKRNRAESFSEESCGGKGEVKWQKQNLKEQSLM
jgi:hypothetical protein